MSLYLLAMSPDRDTRAWLIERERIEIGRADSVDIKLDDRGVSRNHARLFINSAALRGEITEYAAEMTDAGSSYGIWVSGAKTLYTCLLYTSPSPRD